MKLFQRTAVLASLVTPALAAPAGTGPIDIGDSPSLTLSQVIDASPDHQVLSYALEVTGLYGALNQPGNLTLFAPTDDAFYKLPVATLRALASDPSALAAVLQFHVLPDKKLSPDVLAIGGSATLNGEPVAFSTNAACVFVEASNISIVDYEVSNGVIHQVDDVLVPGKKDLVDSLIADGRFNTLVTAVQAAGLESALRASGPFTLFAPTDAAFAKLPAATLEDLLMLPAILSNILTYHVSPDLLFGGDVASQASAMTLQGQSLTFMTAGGAIFVDQAMVQAPFDWVTGNGVIHAIDDVLLP